MLCELKRPFVCAVAATAMCACLAADPPSVQNRFVKFSFDQVEVPNVVKLVAELTQKKFVVDQQITGKVTFISPDIPVEEVYAVFLSLLEVAGCSVIEERNGVYRVVALSAKHIGAVAGVDDPLPTNGLVTRIIQIRYASVTDVLRVLEPMVRGGKEGAIGIVESTNRLIVRESAENVRKIEKIVAEVDRSDLTSTLEVLQLKHVGAQEVEEQLSRALSSFQDPTRRPMPGKPGDVVLSKSSVAVVASPHSNSIVLLGAPAQVAKIKSIILLMDVESPAGAGRLRPIFVKYISAEEAAKSLNALLGRKAADDKKGPPQNIDPSKISIEAHVPRNALLVSAMPRDFEEVRKLVDDLDRPPEQVLIEVLIVEVSATDDLNIGVDFVAAGLPSAGSTVIQGAVTTKESAQDLMNAIERGVFPRGLSVGVASGRREADGTIKSGFPALMNIDAMRKNSKFKILSNIPLVASNNKEASVNIVNNIPVRKSTVSAGAGTAKDIIQNIERIDVGIKLKFTPQVIPGGEVLMLLNPSIEAIISQGTAADSLEPIIAKREVSTTATVPDGETIVLSGLIREDQTETVQRIPLLGSIPLLGVLFRHTAKGSEKTNLLIFVTPHILTDRGAMKRVTEIWKDATNVHATNVTTRVVGSPEGTQKR